MRAARNANEVFDGNFNAFIWRVMGCDRDGVGLSGDFNRDAIEIGFVMFGGFHGANFDGVAVPALHFIRAVDVLEFERAARLQRIDLVELLTDCGGSGKYSEKKDERE